MRSNSPPVLITLTAPTCAGKSYLFNYIRDEAKMPCIISTTTRAARHGEVQGIDYYFISEDESKQIEAKNGFAELVTYGGIRYGVTFEEWNTKLRPGQIAFVIVEPTGIDHYDRLTKQANAILLKYYIHTDPSVRYERFKARIAANLQHAWQAPDGTKLLAINNTVESALNRLRTMLTEELQWGSAVNWTRILFGENAPAANLDIIMRDVNTVIQKNTEKLEWQSKF